MTIPASFFQAVKDGNLNLDAVQEMIATDPALINARNEQGLSPILIATYYQEPTIAALLIEKGAILNVFEAAATGQLEQIQTLV